MKQLSNSLKKSMFWKRVFSLLIVFALTFTALPISEPIFAAETNTEEGGEASTVSEEVIPIMVHFQSPSYWYNLYAYGWDGNGNLHYGSWPGQALTAQNPNNPGYYTVRHDYSSDEDGFNIIFNTTNDDNGEAKQTFDISISADALSGVSSYEVWITPGEWADDGTGK